MPALLNCHSDNVLVPFMLIGSDWRSMNPSVAPFIPSFPHHRRKDKDGQLGEQDSNSRVISPEFRYNMNHREMGKCIIINNKNFHPTTGTAV